MLEWNVIPSGIVYVTYFHGTLWYNINEVFRQLCWNGIPYTNVYWRRIQIQLFITTRNSMLALLFKEIHLLFTIRKIIFVNGNYQTTLLAYMFPYSFILNICCWLLGLYLTLNTSLYLREENIYLSTWFTYYNNSKDDFWNLC